METLGKKTPPLTSTASRSASPRPKKKRTENHNSTNLKAKRIFFVILSFFELISIFLFHFFFLFTRDSLTDSQPSKRAGSRNRKEADIKRTDRQKSTEAEHVRNKPNTQRRFVEQWGKEIWICFLVHTSPVFVCCKPFCHVCRCVHACLCTPTPRMQVARRQRGWWISAAARFLQHASWNRERDCFASSTHPAV